MSVVFVSIPNGGSAGNVLRTGLVDRLLDADASNEVVLFRRWSRIRRSCASSSISRVRFENLPPHRPAGLEARLLALMQAATSIGRDRVGADPPRGSRRQGYHPLDSGEARAGRRSLSPSIVRKETRYELVDRLVSHPRAERLFDRYRPALLVASSPGLIFSEVPLLRTAVRRGVRSMAVDPSWDNFTNKLLPVRRVDRLVVWNELMKQQAVELHGYQPDEVRVAGAPQWDLYFRGAPRIVARRVLRAHRRRSVAKARSR